MSRRVGTWAAILAVASVALTFLPGFDVLSFYFSMPVAALLGMACGGVSATAVIEARSRGASRRWALNRAFLAALLLTLVPLVVATVSALRVGPCDYAYGLAFYLVGPVASALFGASLGFAVGVLVPGHRLPGVLVPLLFVASFVPNLMDLYRSPAVFFFNPFLGYYPGPIYDDRIEVTSAYMTFRAFCGALAIAGVGLALARTGPDLSVRRRWHVPFLFLALVSAGVAAWLGSRAGDLGFRVTRADVERALPVRGVSALCDIRHVGAMDSSRFDRMLWDCGFQHRRVAAFFGLEPDGPIRVYLYPDAQTKARLMGARHVEVSKPWLREVHITEPALGDPVLGHELAHAVAGRLAPGFLGVPARVLIVPDMAIVEGLAVAASFADDGPSRHEWALAMRHAGLPVDPVALFEPDEFLGAGAGTAYTVAGSVVAWVAQTRGTSAVQALARGDGFPGATGHELADLVPAWQAFLEDTVGATLDRALIDRAGGRFNDPGVLRRRCPTDVARALDAVDRAYQDGDLDAAYASLRTARALDPGFRALARESLRVAARRGDPAAALEADALLTPADPELPPTPADRVAAADAWLLGVDPGPLGIGRARAELVEALWAFGSGPEARGVCVRLMALDAPEPVRDAVVQALARGIGPDPEGLLLEALAAHPEADLARYLLARLDLGRGRYVAAADLLADLSDRDWPVAEDAPPDGCGNSLRGQVAQIGARASFWAGRFAQAERLLDRAEATSLYQGERLLAAEYRSRIAQITREGAAWVPEREPLLP